MLHVQAIRRIRVPARQSGAGAHRHKKCLTMFARERCTVSDVLVQLDVLAGREVLRRAGRGEEYDPMTGELVACCAKKH